MKSIKTKFVIPAMATVMFFAMTASAAVIYDTDYDNSSEYSQNDTAAPVISVFNDDANTNGVGGSDALSLEFDASAVVGPSDYALNMFSNQKKTGTLATSNSAADYTLEFDVSAVGLVSSPQQLIVDVRFQGGSIVETGFFTVTGTGFDHISLNLATIGSGFATLTSANINNSMSLKFYTYNNAAGKFGRDAGNGIFVDNVTLTAIPEPSSLLLLLVAGGAFLFLRRKK